MGVQVQRWVREKKKGEGSWFGRRLEKRKKKNKPGGVWGGFGGCLAVGQGECDAGSWFLAKGEEQTLAG